MTNNAGQTFVVHYKNVEEKEDQEKIKNIEDEEEVIADKGSNQILNDDAQKRIIKAFLDGEDCLTGVTNNLS